ncbi:hypothetical protein KP509_08G056400 [Ceratopteris richardii]|uniref:Uncharacterized protein n=1 Tax=Ceratopteris richardii TaxID=49495 RepID=A0A8T2U5T3_CERRI|nr:hypothetical protein KP509_08G056400 [Ceratopteris richardii]
MDCLEVMFNVIDKTALAISKRLGCVDRQSSGSCGRLQPLLIILASTGLAWLQSHDARFGPLMLISNQTFLRTFSNE